MTKRKHRTDFLDDIIVRYNESRTFTLLKFSNIHFRLTDDYTTIDIWPTTGKYWVSKTSYHEVTDKRIVERAGEKGQLPYGEETIFKWLDDLFFAAEKLEENTIQHNKSGI